MLYALGVGATELDFVYERSLKALPTFAVIPAFPAMTGMSAGIEINLVMVLHGEQSFRIHKTIPTKGKLTTTGKVAERLRQGQGRAGERRDRDARRERRADLHEHVRRLRARRGRLRRRARARGGEHPAGARAGQDGRDGDAADPGDDLPPLGRPEPAAHRPGLREDGGVRPADPARALHLRARGPRGAARVLRERRVALRGAVGAASRASSTRATPSSPRCGTRASGKVILQAKTQEGRVVISNAAAEVK